jgi:periplasmic copper chaperone A
MTEVLLERAAPFFVGVIVKPSQEKVQEGNETVKRVLMLVLTIAFLLSACVPEKGIQVREAWARPAPQGENGAIYFVIENHSSETHEMTGVASDIAEAVEMHESRMSGDVMEMQQLESVSLGQGKEVVFEPGGLHIMLIRLRRELKVGDEIEITLQFKNFEDLNVTVPVRDTPAPGEVH